MDKTTRSQIQRMTQEARRLLEREYTEQLEGTYDIRPDGSIGQGVDAKLGDADRLLRTKLLAVVEHARSGGATDAAAVAAYVRGAAFTTLNRFVALKMLEARTLVRECLSRGDQSSGFKEYGGLAPGLVQLPDRGYRLFIESLFDELGTEVKLLFDRRDPAGLLWPRPRALAGLLDLLNAPELAGVWAADETLGWVYQYFNGEDERRQMRAESGAPRNSRELAVRNQFFTPRYVVEFLADNTLGRLWYEMREGRTALLQRCGYLVRRELEIFLPEHGFEGDDFGLNARDLVHQAGWRDLPEEADFPLLAKVALALDGYSMVRFLQADGDEGGTGAVGRLANGRLDEYSNTGTWRGNSFELWLCLFFEQRRYHHFGYGPEGKSLEALQALYRAWRAALAAEAAGTSAGESEVRPNYVRPRLNKDPRDIRVLDPACGSMHFGLYAFDLLETMYHEAWSDGRAPASVVTGRSLRQDYPDEACFRAAVPGLILRHNVHGVDIDPRAIQIAALTLWMRAQRAYNELGLPRAERPPITQTRLVVAEPMPGEADLRTEFVAGLDARLGSLVNRVFERMDLAGEMGPLLRIEDDIQTAVRDVYLDHGEMFRVLDEARWQAAETALLEALRVYAEQATGGAGFRRRLFAEDAAQGFAFIDICRQRYDVVLMNPPFGAGSLRAKAAFEKAYPRTKNDVYAAFVERGVQLLHKRGLLGAITSRTGFFLSSFQKWREEVLLKEAGPTVFADLGYGVLDSAMVEVAAYCLEVTE